LPLLLLAAGWLVLGCSAPAPAETSVTLSSESGLIEATIHFEAPVQRGDNTLVVELAAPAGGEPQLGAVNAFMVAHNHQSHAGSIRETSLGFEASQLDLFMTGRWQLELELRLAGQSDLVSMPVDVP
jgi:hypothetical protein